LALQLGSDHIGFGLELQLGFSMDHSYSVRVLQIAIRIEWIAHMTLGWDCNLVFNGSLLLDNEFLCPFTTNVMTAACQEEIFWRSVHGRAVLFCFLEVAKAQIGG
jgi:hypothetical protein